MLKCTNRANEANEGKAMRDCGTSRLSVGIGVQEVISRQPSVDVLPVLGDLTNVQNLDFSIRFYIVLIRTLKDNRNPL